FVQKKRTQDTILPLINPISDAPDSDQGNRRQEDHQADTRSIQDGCPPPIYPRNNDVVRLREFTVDGNLDLAFTRVVGPGKPQVELLGGRIQRRIDLMRLGLVWRLWRRRPDDIRDFRLAQKYFDILYLWCELYIPEVVA